MSLLERWRASRNKMPVEQAMLPLEEPTMDTPPDMIELAQSVIDKCRERCIEAVENGKPYPYHDSPAHLKEQLGNSGVFSSKQMEKFDKQLEQINYDCRVLRAKSKLTSMLMGTYGEEFKKQEQEKLKAMQGMATQQLQNNYAAQQAQIYNAQAQNQGLGQIASSGYKTNPFDVMLSKD